MGTDRQLVIGGSVEILPAEQTPDAEGWYNGTTRSRFLPPSRADGCRLERSIVAEGCCLYEADIQESVVGLRSVVRPGARLRQVVMMGADFYQSPEEKAEARSLGQPRMGIGS